MKWKGESVAFYLLALNLSDKANYLVSEEILLLHLVKLTKIMLV